MAIYACAVSSDFESAIRLAVTHDGDSDSTGSMAGNIWGIMHGEQCLPEAWLEVLEGREVIGRIRFVVWEIRRAKICRPVAGSEFLSVPIARRERLYRPLGCC